MVILAVIGKVLLVILKVALLFLLFALVSVALVLLVPVRYRITWERNSGNGLDKEDTGNCVRGLIHWCLFVVRIPFSYNKDGGGYSIRIMGIDIRKVRRHFGSHAQRRRKAVKRDAEDGERTCIDGEETRVDSEKAAEKKADDKERKQHVDGGQVAPDTLFHKVQRGVRRFFERIKDIWQGILRFWKWIKQFPVHLREWKGRAGNYVRLLRADFTRESICVVWENVVHLWSRLKPQKISGYVRFGFDDPCQTGQLLGVFGALMGMSGIYLEMMPEFQKEVLEGIVKLEGRITIFTLLSIIIKLYRDDNIMQLRSAADRL